MASLQQLHKVFDHKSYCCLLASYDLRTNDDFGTFYSDLAVYIFEDTPLGFLGRYQYFLRPDIETLGCDSEEEDAYISRYQDAHTSNKQVIYGISIGELVCRDGDEGEKKPSGFCVIMDVDHQIYVAWHWFWDFYMDHGASYTERKGTVTRKLPGNGSLPIGMAKISRENWAETPSNGITEGELDLDVVFSGDVRKEPISVEDWQSIVDTV